jgi:DDE superfamily endonuclease
LREHSKILPLLTVQTDDDLRVLGDLGYEGEHTTITVAFKKPKNAACTDVQQQFNRAHNAVRAIGERGNTLLKTTFKALRNVSLCPWTISPRAALVILHIEHGRTT